MNSAQLHAAGEPVGLRIVGGGALALRHFERRTTVDLDSVKVHYYEDRGAGDVVATVNIFLYGVLEGTYSKVML